MASDVVVRIKRRGRREIWETRQCPMGWFRIRMNVGRQSLVSYGWGNLCVDVSGPGHYCKWYDVSRGKTDLGPRRWGD